jgi:hypothetical protein
MAARESESNAIQTQIRQVVALMEAAIRTEVNRSGIFARYNAYTGGGPSAAAQADARFGAFSSNLIFAAALRNQMGTVANSAIGLGFLEDEVPPGRFPNPNITHPFTRLGQAGATDGAALGAPNPIDGNYFTNAAYRQLAWNIPGRTVGANNNVNNLIGYTMTMENHSQASVQIILTGPGTAITNPNAVGLADYTPGIVAMPGDYIVIPLVIRTGAESPSVSVLGHTRGLAGAAVNLGQTRASFAHISDQARGRVFLSELTITEQTTNVLDTGWLILVPPPDYNQA